MITILDSHGRPLQRAIGFIGGYVITGKALLPAESLYVVGVEPPARTGEGEDDAARNRNRTRRAG
jgi:hypothetical protein